MTAHVPPPEQRFDPITARWLTPGGPLFDPDRAAMDDDEAVTLIGPIPDELAHASNPPGSAVNPYARMRRVVLVTLAVVALALFGFSTIGYFG